MKKHPKPGHARRHLEGLKHTPQVKAARLVAAGMAEAFASNGVGSIGIVLGPPCDDCGERTNVPPILIIEPGVEKGDAESRRQVRDLLLYVAANIDPDAGPQALVPAKPEVDDPVH